MAPQKKQYFWQSKANPEADTDPWLIFLRLVGNSIFHPGTCFQAYKPNTSMRTSHL